MQENPGAQVLTAVLKDPGRPRITWYGADGERVELSGAVLANWVAKTANLLVDELDAGPGTRVRLDLPAHWRTIVWALATWYVGAVVQLDDEPADVVVTAQPPAATAAATAVAVALPALARRFGAELPVGVLDYAATVLGQPDTPPSHLPAVLGAPALIGPAGCTSVDALTARVEPSPARRLITTGRPRDGLLMAVRANLAAGGSVVLADQLSAERLAALASAERVDVQDVRA